MITKRKNIPNPSALSTREREFVKGTSEKTQVNHTKNTFKGRMISMSDDFFNELNEFLRNNPTEGNRSSFIVRVIAEYIKNKKTTF